MKHKWEQKAKCNACKGTGIYVGLAERDGAGVVCHTCKGSGCKTIVVEWEEFDGREERSDVSRVVEVNPGICIGEGKSASYDLHDFGGMSYQEWRFGKPFPPKSEMRKFVCPAWWYQTADYQRKPNWDKCTCGVFSACKHFHEKSKCWAQWDREFGER